MKEESFWDKYSTWKEAETAWDKKKEQCRKAVRLKELTYLPSMATIVDQTKNHIKWKALLWILRKDKGMSVIGPILRHPFRHGYRYLRSLFSRNSYHREGDLFFYGIHSNDQLLRLLKNNDTLFLMGFSYCQKPFECPSGRFSAQCIASSEHPVCGQCFIGKCTNTLPKERTIPLVIPTIHYIGRKVFEIQEQFPGKQLVFVITTCEMMLEMFGDFGNMVGIKGMGIRLGGRVCNTFRAFELAEQGIKPGLTILLPESEKQVLEYLASWRQDVLQETHP